jgi:beta-galactosidase
MHLPPGIQVKGRTINKLSALPTLLLLLASAALAQRENFDKDWRFTLGHASNAELDFNFSAGSFSAFAKAGTDAGPIGLGTVDESWRTVNLPHDWAIELPFDATADLMHGYKPVGRAFPQNSIGWYRKSFQVPKEDEGKRLRITFDGIYRDAYIWINGHLLGRNESGYIGATYDLADYVKYGARNIISVRVDASFSEGWFYEGAGIYRHVWLTKSNPVHFVQDGVAILPSVEKSNLVSVKAEVLNTTAKIENQAVTVTVKDADGKVVGAGTGKSTRISGLATATLEANLTLKAVRRWSIEDPYLYTCEVSTPTDHFKQKIGFRSFKFDVDKGFFLNGKPLKIKGTCNHQDHAGVGAAIPDRLNEWRIAQLKKIGCNFYRTSHNPPTPELLDACDRLGMMVLDETRMFGSTGEALSQLQRLVRRDRNHPSVIFWSIGNEEWGTQTTPESTRISLTMMQTIKQLDPTRPVTFAANNGVDLGGVNAAVDIRGFNYNLGAVDGYRKARPNQPIHGSEVASTVTTRGEYENNPTKAYVAAYDTQKIDWGSTAEAWWKITLARDWFAGGFVWTGFDYRGEPTPYSWPNISSHFGILDTCGFPKDVAFYYKAWWTDQPVLHILPDWNRKGSEGKPVDVWVFSNHEEVELFLNGKSLGKKKMEVGGHLSWSVPYEPGKLSAIGYRAGKTAQESSVETTGEAVKLILETDHQTIDASGADVAVVIIKAVDAQGRVVPDANFKLDLQAKGVGQIIGVGNGDPSCHEPDTLIATPNVMEIKGWKMKRLTGDPLKLPETAAAFDDSSWSASQITGNQLRTNGEMAVFRTTFDVENLATYSSLSVGPIDDLGWVYLNGELIGTTKDWAASHRFEIGNRLKKGRNVLAIVAQNEGGAGGFSRGVSLVGQSAPPAWGRSLFHGLAQVILKSGDKAGELTIRARGPGGQAGSLTIKVR